MLIQAGNLSHPVLQFVQQHDFVAFYNAEIENRKKFFYPPFSRIIQVTFRHKMKEIVDGAAHQFARSLAVDFEKYLTGPAEPVVNRVRNQYLMELMLKLPKDGGVLSHCKKAIHDQTAMLHMDKKYRSVVVIPDVDKV